ncbi:MAG: heme ABC exporter ATP-binding protein CcmA [Anaerolineaceae bacterium]|nr:heme ABC exporter ATP-binding protein CcmA [Anaerolineaceae bacterium]
MSDTPAVLSIRELVKIYDFIPVLRQLDLDVAQGDCVALLGPNGSGKSTLLRLIAGLIKPSSGTIEIGGWQMPKEAAAVRAQIGMVSHQSLLYGNLTARENLVFFARLYDVPKNERDDRIAALLEQVGLTKRAESLVRTFSRGMQQRLSIARALLHSPHVLLFDEPYSGLDQDAAAMLDDIIRHTHQDGQTMMISTHLLERAQQVATRVMILNRGRVVLDKQAVAIAEHQLASVYAQAIADKIPSDAPQPRIETSVEPAS